MTGPVLADACALIDFLLEPVGSMSAAGDAAMRGDVLVSPITVWKIGRKMSLGKLPPVPGGGTGLSIYLAARGFRPRPFAWADAERANALPPLHRDPMDRMLIAQALNAGLTIITIDRIFQGYGVTTLW